MNVLGLAYGYHDAAACLVQDGVVVAAAQEERFNRQKHYAGFPLQATNYCLQQGGITVQDVDSVAFYEKPYLKFHRLVMSHLEAWPFSIANFLRTLPPWLSDRLVTPMTVRSETGYDGDMRFIRHHLSHAASAYLVSPFDEAAIVVSDGVGEWATLSWGIGQKSSIEMRQELRFPHSLGLLYSAVTSYLGFHANGGEGKTMGLADWGEPEYLDAFRKLVNLRPDGSFRLDTRYFDFMSGRHMYSRRFVREFGPPRGRDAPFEERHRNIAASLQKVTEEVLLTVVRHVHEESGLTRLCLAGGSFLNCPTNTRILNETGFDEVYVQPAAGDAGGALGAAVAVAQGLKGEPRGTVMDRACFGPEFSDPEMRRALAARGANFEHMEDHELFPFVARQVADGSIVGWFQGRMEFGPRALGSRTILADARNPDMKDLLNSKVKHRESFRPYGVSVLAEEAPSWFECDGRESPFMLFTHRVRPEKAAAIPSAVHVGRTSRIQTVTGEDERYHRVIKAFQALTNVPMMINTSFNDNTEPIVCTPNDAYGCFANTHMDYLVVGNYVAKKTD